MRSPVDGTTAGYWCDRSAVAPSPTVVSDMGVPPSADTCSRFSNVLKTMTLSFRQTPKLHCPFCIPRASVTGGDPSSATFFSSPPMVKNPSECPRAIQRQRPACERRLQRLAVEVLHDEVDDPVAFANVMEGADVWMFEL